MTSVANWRSWLVPPAISEWALRRRGGFTQLDDSIDSWESAKNKTSGYDQQLIVEKVFTSTQSVLHGEAAFERDSVTFDKIEYRWPVVTGLLSVAANEGELRVLDFGGALGSLYWQHQSLLSDLRVSWSVVEQSNYVQMSEKLDQRNVNFFESINSATQEMQPNVIVLSSVIQYLPEPEIALQELLHTSADTLILDRTPMADIPSNVACIQRVPTHIYSASYPAWIISRGWLHRQLSDWKIIAEFPGIEPVGISTRGIPYSWDGLIAQRQSHD